MQIRTLKRTGTRNGFLAFDSPSVGQPVAIRVSPVVGAPAEKGIAWAARHPELMKKLQQDHEQKKEKQAGLLGSPMIARPSRPVPPPITEKLPPPIAPAPPPHRVTK